MDEERLPLISIHSHKGGVGKTTVATLMALALSEEHTVCLVDLDLVAPSVSVMLGIRPNKPRILEYLLGDPETPHLPPKPDEVCKAVTGPYGTGRKLFVIPGVPAYDPARGVQSYILADLRAGVIRSRIELLLQEVRKQPVSEEDKVDVFILDTPPSLFGLSSTARKLVEKHRGAETFVVTPTIPDLNGLRAMLLEIEQQRQAVIEEASKKGEAPPVPVARAIAVNRYTGDTGRAWEEEELLDLFGRASRGERVPRTRTRRLTSWLERYTRAPVPASPAIEGMTRLLGSKEKRPTASELFKGADRLRKLAVELFEQVTARPTP